MLTANAANRVKNGFNIIINGRFAIKRSDCKNINKDHIRENKHGQNNDNK